MGRVLEEKIKSKKAVIGVIGLGFVGLYSLDAFARAGFSLVGFDINETRVKLLKERKIHIRDFPLKLLYELMLDKKFEVTTNPYALKKADIILLSAPTPLDIHEIPDLNFIRASFQTALNCLEKDQMIILESSAYPGVTERELRPVLEKSGLKVGKDFYIAYAPEMFDFGNCAFSFTQVPKIVSGITPACLKMVTLFYETVGNTVVQASATSIAESAKLLQNAYRLINISFINEMKMMFDHMGIDIWEVIKVASSKPFGFTPFIQVQEWEEIVFLLILSISFGRPDFVEDPQRF